MWCLQSNRLLCSHSCKSKNLIWSQPKLEISGRDAGEIASDSNCDSRAKQNYNVQARNQVVRAESNCAGQESAGPARKLTMRGRLGGVNLNIGSDDHYLRAGTGPHAYTVISIKG
jgi:hypothetical protein